MTLNPITRLTNLVGLDRKTALKKRLMGDWPKGRELRGLLGPKVAEQVFDLILANDTIKTVMAMKGKTDEQMLEFVDDYLKLEIANCTRTMRHIHQAAGYKLNSGQFATLIANHVMPETAYGANTGDTPVKKAAQWVVNASLTARSDAGEVVFVEKMITMAMALGTPVNNMAGLDTINKLLSADNRSRHDARGPVVSSPLPSSPGGRAMLEAAILFLQSRTPGSPGCRWADLGCYLFGAVVGCHGFSDANGRTGRTLYAICQLKAGGFTGINVAGENLLTALS